MKVEQQVAADVAPLRSATRLNPTVESVEKVLKT